MKEEKQMKGELEKMKSKIHKAGNRRNNINSISSNNNNTNNSSNSKYKCGVWRRRINKKSRAIERNTIRGTSKGKVKFKIRRI